LQGVWVHSGADVSNNRFSCTQPGLPIATLFNGPKTGTWSGNKVLGATKGRSLVVQRGAVKFPSNELFGDVAEPEIIT